MLQMSSDNSALLMPFEEFIEFGSTSLLSPCAEVPKSPLHTQDPYSAYVVSDLHLSRLGLSSWASESVSSTTSSSFATSPPAFSPRSSCASPIQSSSIWAPLASTSALSSVAEDEEVVITPRKRKVKTYTCERDKCGKVFNRSSGLRRHLMIHTGDRPYACTTDGCDKAFVQPSALKVHQRVHTGQRPHPCEYDGCHKSFADPSCLAKHRRTHIVVKPFQCFVLGCRITFKRQSTRDRHAAQCAKKCAQRSLCNVSQSTSSRLDPLMSEMPDPFEAVPEPWPSFLDQVLAPGLLPDLEDLMSVPQMV